MAEEDGEAAAWDAACGSSASPVPLHLRGKVTHFLPNLHADPAKFHAHIAALSGVGWSNKQIVIERNVQLVCGGGAIGSTSGWDKVTEVNIPGPLSARNLQMTTCRARTQAQGGRGVSRRQLLVQLFTELEHCNYVLGR